MKRETIRLFIGVLLLAGLSATADARLTREETQEAEALIGQFSAPEPAVRRQAVEKLAALGPDVVPLVGKVLATTTDNEVKLRCELALKALAGKHGADAVVVQALRHTWVRMMGASRSEAAEERLQIARLFPDSRYADDALYLAGLAFVMAKRYPEAVRAFEAVIERYPRGVFVADGSWGESMHGIHLCRGRVREPLLNDAIKAVGLYEKYLEAYPEHTSECARYWLAVVHTSHLNDPERGKAVLGEIPEVPVRESRILGYQDQLFRERLQAGILKALVQRSVGPLNLAPTHALGGTVREFRARLGMKVAEDPSGESDEALRREAEVRVEAFLKENMPEFRIGEVIRQEELAREEKLSRAEREREALESACVKALKTLEDANASAPARSRAVLVVGRAGKREAVPLLLRQLDREPFEGVVVQNTMRALGDLRDPRAVPHLLKYLDGTTTVPQDDVEHVQRNAISALGEVGDRSVLPRLREYLDSEYESVRVSARSAVARLEKLNR